MRAVIAKDREAPMNPFVLRSTEIALCVLIGLAFGLCIWINL